MSKHNPGPWSIDERGVLIASNEEEIALVGWGTPTDARLIAAAPRMLELLRLFATGVGPNPGGGVCVDGALLFRMMQESQALLAEIDGDENPTKSVE